MISCCARCLRGLMVALAAGPLGCFVVWRRMAYFGDATAHAAILGVALALGFALNLYLGIILVALAMAMTVAALAGRGWAMDTTLGVLAHSALACGLVAVSYLPGVRVDLSSYLFGDILAVSRMDLAVIALGAVAVLALLAWRWRPLLTATLSEDLAHAAGLNPARERLVLTVALAIVVAVSLKIVGALLIAAMLIIPAAAARNVARGPESMALGAVALGGLSVWGGLQTVAGARHALGAVHCGGGGRAVLGDQCGPGATSEPVHPVGGRVQHGRAACHHIGHDLCSDRCQCQPQMAMAVGMDHIRPQPGRPDDRARIRYRRAKPPSSGGLVRPTRAGWRARHVPACPNGAAAGGALSPPSSTVPATRSRPCMGQK